MLIPSVLELMHQENPSLSRRVNANSQLDKVFVKIRVQAYQEG